MAELTTLARPYAKAAFEVAMEGNDLENWSNMLSLAASVSSVDSIRIVLGSPTLTAEQLARVPMQEPSAISSG